MLSRRALLRSLLGLGVAAALGMERVLRLPADVPAPIADPTDLLLYGWSQAACDPIRPFPGLDTFFDLPHGASYWARVWLPTP